MSKFRKGISGLLAFVMILSAFVCNMVVTASAAGPTIWVVGDSTACNYKATDDATYYYKRVGFGDKIAEYLNKGSATVQNLALSGKSSRSFVNESNYKKLDNMQSGDYLLIAFGHNDEKIEDASIYTSPGGDKNTEGSFKKSLYDNYIKKAQDKGAIPILCTPIVRHPSGASWTPKDQHQANDGDYSQDIRDLAKSEGIGCIDLTALTKSKYEEVGLDVANKFHAWPTEKNVDNTHLNNYGAKMVAYLIASNAPSGFKSLFVSAPAAPTEEEDLTQNPGYVPPPEGDLTDEQLKSNNWTTTSPWYASAFGDIGGNFSKSNFNIAEDGSSVNIAAKSNKGKVSSTSNGVAMYFRCVSANENYQITADAHINSIDNANNQVSFGAIIADEVRVDSYVQGYGMNYVAAGPVNMATGKPSSSFMVDHTASRLTTGTALPAMPAAGDDVTVKIVKVGNKYTTSYKTAYGNFISEYTLNDEQMSGYMYPGLFAARNADITFSNITANNEVNEVEGNAIVRSAGKVTYTDAPANGSVTLTKDDGTAVANGTEEVAAGTSLTLKAEPVSGYYPSVKVGEKELILTDNAYKWEVDGDVTFNIEFITANERIPVTETVSWTAGTNDDIVQQYNQHLTTPYYFDLESGATLDATSKRINIGSGYGVVFNTGDLTGKEATLVVNFASSGAEVRTLNLNGTGIGSTTATAGEYGDTAPVTLESGTTYTLRSAGSGMYLKGITITVTPFVSVTPKFMIGEQEASGTYKIDGKDYNTGEAILLKAGTYDVVFKTEEGTEYLGTLVVSADTPNPEVILQEAQSVEVTGTVTIQNKTEVSGVTLSYTNTATNEETPVTIPSDGNYTVLLKPGTYSVKASELDGYTLSSLSVDNFTVSASDKDNNFNNILYKKDAVPATDLNVYVNAAGDSSKQNVYPTLAQALAGISASSLKATEDNKWVIHFAPGTYREQNIVNIDNVTFTSDYNDTGKVENDNSVVLTWYYGVGYKYYSIKPVATTNSSANWSGQTYYRGMYDIEYAYDKHNLTATADRWGTTVRVTGKNFYAEGITFENSFNRYMTDEEIADGVTLASAQEFDANNNNTTVTRTKNTDVRTKAATERAAVLDLYNNKAELYKCSLKSSQDTLYMQAGMNYFKDCIIMGETDYIFGAEPSVGIFDNCDLVWAGYVNPGKNGAGYVTATRGRLIFRDCPITGKTDLDSQPVGTSDGEVTVTPGYYGRPWGETANVTFINSETNGLIVAEGWNKMDKTDPEQATFREYNNTSNGGEFKSTLKDSQLTEEDAAALAAENDFNFFTQDWLPKNHVPYEIPEIEGSLVTWNFRTANTSLGESGVIQSGTGTITVNDDKLGIVALNVDASTGKIWQRTDGDAQFNNTTKLTIPVYQEGDEISISAYDTQYTVNGIPAVSNTTELTASADDIGKGIEVVATGNTYLYSITLHTLYEPVPTTKVTWDFQNNNTDLVVGAQHQGGEQFQISVIDNPEWKLDVTAAGKITLRAEKDLQVNTDAVIKVPVAADGDKITVIAHASYLNFTVAGTPAAAGTTVYTATADDAAKGYVEVKGTGNSSYLYSISLETTGTPPVEEEMNDYNFDFVEEIGEAGVKTGTVKEIPSKSGSIQGTLTVDTTDNTYGTPKLRYNDASYGYEVSPSTKFIFTLSGEGSLNTKITIGSTYNAASDVVIKVYAADDMNTDLGTITLNGESSDTISFTGEGGKEYVVVVTSGSNFYTKGLEISTAGLVEEKEPTTDITWTFAPDNNPTLPKDEVPEGNKVGYMCDKDSEAGDAPSVVLYVDTTATGAKFAPQKGAGNAKWTQIKEGTVIKVPVYAAGDKITVDSYVGGSYTTDYTIGTGSYTGNSWAYTANEADAAAGYVTLTKSNGQGYIGKLTLSTTGNIPAPELKTIQVIKKDANDGKVDVYVIAKIAGSAIGNVEGIGIGAGKHASGAYAEDSNVISSDYTGTVFEQIVIDEQTTIKEDGSYLAAVKISDVDISGADVGLYAAPYSMINGKAVYDDVDNLIEQIKEP